MEIRFAIPRKPVSVNEMYVNSNRGRGAGKGRFLSSAARDFKDCARAYALIAARKASWPRPEAVKAVAMELTAFGSRHDVDAPAKAAMDSFEGVLYKRDAVVQELLLRRASDDGPVRIEVVVRLLS